MTARFARAVAAAIAMSAVGACAGVSLPDTAALTDLQTVKPELR